MKHYLFISFNIFCFLIFILSCRNSSNLPSQFPSQLPSANETTIQHEVLDSVKKYLSTDQIAISRILIEKKIESISNQDLIVAKFYMMLGEYFLEEKFVLDSTNKYFTLAYESFSNANYFGEDYFEVLCSLTKICTYYRKNNLGNAYANILIDSTEFIFEYDSSHKTQAYLAKGNMIYRVGKYEEAIQYLEIARQYASAKPENFIYQDILKNILQVIIKSKNDILWTFYDNLFLKNIEEYGDKINYHRIKGVWLATRDKKAESIIHLEKAMDYELNIDNPSYPALSNISYYLSIGYAAKGHYNEAIGLQINDAFSTYGDVFADNKLYKLIEFASPETDYLFINLEKISHFYLQKYYQTKNLNDLNIANKVFRVAEKLVDNQLKTVSEDALQELFLNRAALLDIGIQIQFEKFNKTSEEVYVDSFYFYSERKASAILNSEIAQLKMFSEIKQDSLRKLKMNAKSSLLNSNVSSKENDNLINLDRFLSTQIENKKGIFEDLFSVDKDRAQLSNSMMPDEQVLVYHVIDSAIFILYIIDSGSTLYREKLSAKAKEGIQVLTHLNEHHFKLKSNAYNEIAYNIYTLLLKERIVKKTVYVQLNGILDGLNLELLTDTIIENPTYANLPYLVKKHCFIKISSCNNLADFKLEISDKKINSKKALAAFSFSNESGVNHKLLPELRGGYTEVHSFLNQDKRILFSANEATKQNFIQAYSNPQISHIHLSCHGKSNSNRQEDLQLYFRKTNLELDTLWGFELLALESNVESIILSSCESSDGYYNQTEKYNLDRYFHLGGARFVVSTNWEVSDYASAEIFTRFYQFFPKEPLPSALQKAKVLFIEDFPSLAHPYYWGGIVIN